MKERRPNNAVIELALPSSSPEANLAAQRKKILLFLSRVQKCLDIDCANHSMFDRDLLQLFVEVSQEARSQGKQIRLLNVSSGVAQTLRKNQDQLPIDFLERQPTAAKKKRKREKLSMRRMLSLFGLALCSIPAIFVADRLLNSDFRKVIVSESANREGMKTFEDATPVNDYQVLGTVRYIRNGKQHPDPNATIIVIPESHETQCPSLAVQSRPDGSFLVNLPGGRGALSVRVIVLSSIVAQRDVASDSSAPSPKLDQFKQPAARSISQLCYPDFPVVVDALFF